MGRLVRSELGQAVEKVFGASQKELSELSDKELEEELLRRRRARAASQGYAPPEETGATAHEPGSPQAKQLKQYYTNLELKAGASLEEVRQAYRDLMKRYHPDKHIGDAERHRAATELAQSLTKAYHSLVEHLGKK